MPWPATKARILQAYEDLSDVDILVYEPHSDSDRMARHRRKAAPELTPSRAALVLVMDRYVRGLMEPLIVTLLEVHKLVYFLQNAGLKMRLKFVKGHYGPYAENLPAMFLATWRVTTPLAMATEAISRSSKFPLFRRPWPRRIRSSLKMSPPISVSDAIVSLIEGFGALLCHGTFGHYSLGVRARRQAECCRHFSLLPAMELSKIAIYTQTNCDCARAAAGCGLDQAYSRLTPEFVRKYAGITVVTGAIRAHDKNRCPTAPHL